MTVRKGWPGAVATMACLMYVGACSNRYRTTPYPYQPKLGVYQLDSKRAVPVCYQPCDSHWEADGGWRCVCPSSSDAGVLDDGLTPDEVK